MSKLLKPGSTKRFLKSCKLYLGCLWSAAKQAVFVWRIQPNVLDKRLIDLARSPGNALDSYWWALPFMSFVAVISDYSSFLDRTTLARQNLAIHIQEVGLLAFPPSTHWEACLKDELSRKRKDSFNTARRWGSGWSTSAGSKGECFKWCRNHHFYLICSGVAVDVDWLPLLHYDHVE